MPPAPAEPARARGRRRLPVLAAILAGAALLLWPAGLNGYPLVFSDTGAFLSQTLMPLAPFDKPFVYGPALHLLSARVTLWGPAVAQGLLLSWLLWLTQRVVLGEARAGRHLVLCLGLAGLTAAPWFAALLMPDVLAPALVLAVFLLGFGGTALGRAERLGLVLLGGFAAAAHLAHLPLAAAMALLVLALRRRWRPALLGLLPLALALPLLVATNLAVHGRASVSPYGSVFALARLVADGPAARTLAARCPEEPGWRLCAWVGRLPRDSDEFLWAPRGPVWGDGGPIALAPEASAILRETLAREPLAVLRAAADNAVAQLGRVRVGDTLGPQHLDVTVARMLAEGFPPAEQARFRASLQAQGALPAAAAPFLPVQEPLLLFGALAAGFALLRWRAQPMAAALALIALAGVAVNAAVTGALSAPHDRYGARIAWLLPLAGLLALSSRAQQAARPADRAPPAA